MQLHKIRQYSPLQLIRILLYRLLLEGKMSLRKTYVMIAKPRYGEVKGRNAVDITYKQLVSSLSSYYKFLSSDSKEIIEDAELILSGYTSVFGHRYPFNPETDWLKDLGTNNFWPRDIYWIEANFIEKGLSDVKHVLEVNKLNDVVFLANAYYINKDEKYIRTIELYLNGWVNCVPLEKSVANKIVMDIGFRVINLIHVSLLCGDNEYFRNIVHPKVMGIVRHHVAHLWKYLSSRWYKAGNDNNHNIGEIVGLYVGQIWLREFGVNVYINRIGKELEYLKDVTERMVAPSGCYMEQSSNYTRVVHDFFLMFELFRHGLDNQRSFGWFDTSGYFDKLSNYLLDISYHGQLPNFGDNDYARVVIPFEERKNVVGHVRKHFHNTIVHGDYSSNGQWVYHSHDENDVCIFTRAGVFAKFVEGAFAHSHNDLLSIELFIKGQPIFIDKGTLYYNSGSDIRKEFSSTGAHNTIQIGTREMADFLPIGYSNYPKSSILKSKKEDYRCLFKGIVTYKDICHFRTIEYKGNALSIKDEITVESPTTEHGNLHYLLSKTLVAKPIAGGFELFDNLGNYILSLTFKGADECTVTPTSYAPHYALREDTNQIDVRFKLQQNMVIETYIQIATEAKDSFGNDNRLKASNLGGGRHLIYIWLERNTCSSSNHCGLPNKIERRAA